MVEAVTLRNNDGQNPNQQIFNQIMSNVKRRIYDVVNVLVSSGIIVKDRRMIRLPQRSVQRPTQQISEMETQGKQKTRRIKRKKRELEQLKVK